VRRIVALLASALVIASCTSEPTGGADSDGLATVGDGWQVTYASYFGGTGAEGGVVAAGADGTVYLGGSTDSTDLRSTPGAAIGAAPGGGDAFVARLDATGAMTWLTYLGGSGSDELWGLAVAEDGSVYAYGTTASEDFPATPGAIDETLDGPSDVFVAHLSDDGSAILDATYLGGSGLDQSTGTVALAEDGTIVVSGVTASADFPTTRGAMQERFGGGDATLVGGARRRFRGRARPGGRRGAVRHLRGWERGRRRSRRRRDRPRRHDLPRRRDHLRRSPHVGRRGAAQVGGRRSDPE
jgi:hypothetical protein